MELLSDYEKIYTAPGSAGYWYNTTTSHKKDFANWLYAPKWHEHFELKLIVSGTAEILCGTDIFLAYPGDIILINPYEPHGIKIYGDEPLTYHCLLLSPDFAFSEGIASQYARLFEGKLFFKRVLSGQADATYVFKALFRELQEQAADYPLRAEAYIALLFTLLLRYAPTDQHTPAFSNIRHGGEKIRPVLNYINFHYHENISLPYLAELCSMSLYHFCRVFKSTIGYTVVSYINQLRINKASLLLLTTNLSVGEIAHRVGFSDELYFSKRFHQQKGLSPSKYRSQNR